MNVVRGDVVLVNFPFTSGVGSKRRPALVVQTDRNNNRLLDTILAMITTSTQRAVVEPTQVLVDPATADGRQSGLIHVSVVKCEHLFTIDRMLIRRRLGQLSASHQSLVNSCLKVALDLT